eukprot:527046-Amphidinium_carterae.1
MRHDGSGTVSNSANSSCRTTTERRSSIEQCGSSLHTDRLQPGESVGAIGKAASMVSSSSQSERNDGGTKGVSHHGQSDHPTHNQGSATCESSRDLLTPSFEGLAELVPTQECGVSPSRPQDEGKQDSPMVLVRVLQGEMAEEHRREAGGLSDVKASADFKDVRASADIKASDDFKDVRASADIKASDDFKDVRASVADVKASDDFPDVRASDIKASDNFKDVCLSDGPEVPIAHDVLDAVLEDAYEWHMQSAREQLLVSQGLGNSKVWRVQGLEQPSLPWKLSGMHVADCTGNIRCLGATEDGRPIDQWDWPAEKWSGVVLFEGMDEHAEKQCQAQDPQGESEQVASRISSQIVRDE